MRQAVIVNTYAYDNAGDTAILVSTSRLLRQLGVNEICTATRFYQTDEERYGRHGISTIPPLIRFRADTKSRRLVATLEAVSLIVRGAPLLLIRSQAYRRLYARLIFRTAFKLLAENSTCAVVAGGGYMYSSKRLFNASYLHAMISIALCTAITNRVIMMPQSIGPLTKRIDRFVAERALQTLPLIVLRESRSSRGASSLFGARAVQTCPDVAFFGDGTEKYPSRKVGRNESESGRKVVRIVAMDWRWSGSVDAGVFEGYLDALAATASSLNHLGWRVILNGHSALPDHGQDDTKICRRIQARCTTNEIEVDSNCDYSYLVSAYSSADVIIGTRLHSCIMALAVGTPVVGIAYQEKAFGVFEEAGLKHLVLPADNFQPADLMRLVHRSIEDGRARKASDILSSTIADFYRAAAPYLASGDVPP